MEGLADNKCTVLFTVHIATVHVQPKHYVNISLSTLISGPVYILVRALGINLPDPPG